MRGEDMFFFFRRTFPEVNRFPTRDAARICLRRARIRLLVNPWFWLAWTPLVLYMVFVVDPARSVLLHYIDRNTIATWLPLISGLLMPIYILAVIWLLRMPVRRSLRKQLAEMEVPCCIHCGYDLTGNVSGVCPECGEKI